MELRWRVMRLLLVTWMLAGCMGRVVVPTSAEGQRCRRECAVVYNTCVLTRGYVLCSSEQEDCLLTCPGAYRTEVAEAQAVAPPPPPPFEIRLRAAAPYLVAETHRLTRCATEKLSTSQCLEMDGGGRCVVQGCSRVVECTWEDDALRRPKCDETAESAAGALRARAIERLAFEAQCDASTIEVMQTSTTSSESLFRLKACGAIHVCSVEDGRVACRKIEAVP